MKYEELFQLKDFQKAKLLTGEPRRFNCESNGVSGYVKFFDPYIYREPIEFKSEAEATKYYLIKLREQIIYEDSYSIAAIECETITDLTDVSFHQMDIFRESVISVTNLEL